MAGVKASIRVEAGDWGGWARPVVRRAIKAAAAMKRAGPAEVAILLTDDAAIRRLNGAWRGQDKPTNVLSFPAAAGSSLPGEAQLLGDIVLAYETLTAEAAAEGKSAEHHLAHLTVHGFLHLIGFDHENAADAERMEQCEREILAGLGIADPYAAGPA